MNVLHLNGDIFDMDQVVSVLLESTCVRLTFRNGDEIPVRWRDETERLEMVTRFGVGETSSP
jgi:hypothetical protein